ncbi:MAG: TIGR04255 family protein, partial [Chthoniobacter sp.]
MKLTNPPLVEAVFAVRWKLSPHKDGYWIDPKYQIALGRFQSLIEKQFPVWEKLPMAEAPEQVAAYHPLHRFRVSANQYPMLQLGPGVLTINNSTGYEWSEFEDLCMRTVHFLIDAYRDSVIELHNLELRYVNTHPLNELQSMDFLAQKMGVIIQLPEGLFSGQAVQRKTTSFNFSAGFENSTPPGVAQINLRQGKRGTVPSLLWDFGFLAQKELPDFPEGLPEWLKQAREVAHQWFLALTEKHLLEGY